jgi:putative GTP pyrophosphokinase
MKGDMSKLKSEYELKYSQYDKLCKEITIQLAELLRRGHITLAFPIESRVKSWESISQNCERDGITPATLGEIGDVAGLRIIVLFKRDQERVCGIIQQSFDVLEVEDTTTRLSVDQFGYGSIHFQVRPKAEWLALPTLSELRDLQVEIQVRTASQHIWAGASHLFQYKSKVHVPRPVLRAINRVAALLELVDLEFDRVLTERETYVGELSTSEEDQPLNTDILEKVLADELPSGNKLVNEQFGQLLDDLIAFDINNAKSLRALLKKHHDAVFAKEAAQIKSVMSVKKSAHPYLYERAAKGIYFTHSGLTRLALTEEFGKKFDDYMEGKSRRLRQGHK